MKTLGEEVGDVVIRADVSDAQCLLLNPLANSVIPRVDVLATLTGGVRSVNGLSRTQVVIEHPERVCLVSLIGHVFTVELKLTLKMIVAPYDRCEIECKANIGEQLAASSSASSSASRRSCRSSVPSKMVAISLAPSP